MHAIAACSGLAWCLPHTHAPVLLINVHAQVLELVGQLAGSHEDLAALLRRVQEGERDKLRYTLTLQVGCRGRRVLNRLNNASSA